MAALSSITVPIHLNVKPAIIIHWPPQAGSLRWRLGLRLAALGARLAGLPIHVEGRIAQRIAE